MMTTNLFVIANVKQLQTDGSFSILLPFFLRKSWGVGVINSTIFNSVLIRVEFGTIFECLRNLGEGGLNPSNPRSVPRWPLLIPLSQYGSNSSKFMNCITKCIQCFSDLLRYFK